MSQNNTQIAFTKHARERMQLRVISEDMIIATIRKPDKTFLEDDGDTKFIRRVDGVHLHVVCKRVIGENKWLVKSTWVRGEDDHGNRVDRYGNYRGKIKRVTPRTASQSRSTPFFVNGLLIVTLITLVIILVYFLTR